jgi:uncharacterized membrane protein YkoI
MKKSTWFLLMMVFAFSFAACSEEENDPVPIDFQNANNKALAMTTGTIIKTERNTSPSGDYFEVDVQSAGGSIIEFEFYVADGSLKEIEGSMAPFDYEVNPGMGLINFSEARDIALNARPYTLAYWDLEKDSSSGVWTYTFEIENGSESYTVKVNATNGQLISNS